MGRPADLSEVEVVVVQPGSARKRYQCPGCDQPVEPGTFHLVIVPKPEPDLRRHWHRGCWYKELKRRGAD